MPTPLDYGERKASRFEIAAVNVAAVAAAVFGFFVGFVVLQYALILLAIGVAWVVVTVRGDELGYPGPALGCVCVPFAAIGGIFAGHCCGRFVMRWHPERRR